MGQISRHNKKTKLPTKSRKSSNKIKSRKQSMSRIKSSAANFFKKYCNDSFQNKLVDAMNILLNKMENSNDEKEKAFLEQVKKNISDIAKPFLSYDNNKLTLIKKGGGENDEKENDEKENEKRVVVCNNLVREGHNSLELIRRQIRQLNDQLNNERNESNRQYLLHNLIQLTSLEASLIQRQQALNIVEDRESWNRRRYACNQATQLIFTGGAAYMSYLVITLIQGAAGLVTGAAGGLITLLCISILQSISSVVNGVTTRLPGFLGGGEVMDSGRNIINNIMNNLNDILRETPETARIIQRLNDLGYTTNMIAFMILFIFFMIILHFVRIFMTANSFSIGWTGVRVEQIENLQDPLLSIDYSHQNRLPPNVRERNVHEHNVFETTDRLKDDEPQSSDGKGKRSKRKTKKIKKKKTRNSKRNKKRKNRKQSKKKRKAKK